MSQQLADPPAARKAPHPAPVQGTLTSAPPRKASSAPVKRRFLQRPLAILGLALCVGAASFYGLRTLAHSHATESTDDAFTEAHIIAISPKVAGEIAAVHVVQNQDVKAGEPLVEIDPKDYALTVKLREADVATAKTNRETAKSALFLIRTKVDTAKANRDQNNAEAQAAEATAQRAQADFQRAEELRGRKVISAQEYDAARASSQTSTQNLAAARQKLTSAESSVTEAQAQVDAATTYVDAANVKVLEAELQLEQAQNQLSYTKIVAPEDGRVTRKSAEPGAYVQVGQNLLAVVPPHIWVVANFKETQLAKMRRGQPAEIRISTYPGRVFHAHVESFQAGSGASFSLFPPENATGNYVKVVQRVPVRIVFDAEREEMQNLSVLGAGLSVDPEIKVAGEFPTSIIAIVSLVLAIAVCILLSLRAREE